MIPTYTPREFESVATLFTSPTACEIIRLLANHDGREWTIEELSHLLNYAATRRNRTSHSWPEAPDDLARKLRNMRPQLALVGVIIEPLDEDFSAVRIERAE